MLALLCVARFVRRSGGSGIEKPNHYNGSPLVCTGDRRGVAGLFRFMSANQAYFPVATMARVLGVSKAGYYAWAHRPLSAHAVADAALLKRVRTVHAGSRQTYGAPRVHAELQGHEERHSRKRIARLMREAGLVGASHRHGGPVTTRRDKEARPAPDLVDRKFTASGPNELWVADITYVPTVTGFLYLAVVLDAWSRKIVGWSMANHLRTELVLDAMEAAVGQRRPKDVIHHSDQGSQLGFNQSSQRSCQPTVSARQMPLQVFSSRGFCGASC
jgi:putative transposase